MNVDGVWPLLHFGQPLHNVAVRVLWWIEQIDHLKITLVSTGKSRFNVQKFILTFAIVKELRQFVQYDQLDRFIFVNDSFCIVYTVRTGKIHCAAVLFIGDLHRGLCDLKLFLADPQSVNTTQHFLVYRFPQLVMALTQHHHGTGTIIDKLIYTTHTCKTGLRTSTARSQYNVLICAIVEYSLIFRYYNFTDPHLFLFRWGSR